MLSGCEVFAKINRNHVNRVVKSEEYVIKLEKKHINELDDQLYNEKSKDKRWKLWKKLYNRSYDTSEEETYRKSLWDIRDDEIIRFNKRFNNEDQGSSYGHNSVSDMTSEEMRYYRFGEQADSNEDL